MSRHYFPYPKKGSELYKYKELNRGVMPERTLKRKLVDWVLRTLLGVAYLGLVTLFSQSFENLLEKDEHKPLANILETSTMNTTNQ